MPHRATADKVQAKFYLSRSAREKLRRQAKEEDVPMSQIVEELIEGMGE